MDNYYTLLTETAHPNLITAKVSLNASHDLFKGHFPKHPVLPGVCQVQMISAVLARHIADGLLLREAASMKYVAVIHPVETPTLELQIAYEKAEERVVVKAQISADNKIFSKFNLTFGEI